ncbi:MAG: hypothetical protein WDN01_05955 [Rhizomicrobium sp.]
MRIAAAALALFALLGQPASAAAARVVTIAVPRTVPASENLVLRVRAGVLPRGAEIDVYGEGALLGTVSPFAVRGGQGAGTYTIPLPDRLARRGRVTIRLVLTEAGAPPRAPTRRELRGVALVAIGATH